MFVVERVTAELVNEIVPLIEAYQSFYGVTTSRDKTREFFHDLARDDSRGTQFLARDAQSRIVGFATIYFPLSSLRAGQTCLLNDLFTIPELRGKGIARMLIESCQQFAASKGYAKLEWITQDSNKNAQRLYEQLGADRSMWIHYELKT